MVGSAQVDAATRTVIVTGYVNLVQGPIELLACGTEGKRHESIFIIEASPIDLQTALLLAGAEAGVPMERVGQGPPKGSLLDIWVVWQDASGRREERGEYFIQDHEAHRPLRPTSWIFTGSVVENGAFKAMAEQSLIATYWDPWAIINIASGVGANDEILSVNESRVPPAETPVTLHLRLE
jgi:hypothetical protein